ncbi:MAG: glycosyltransferase family 4 protein [Nitrospiraceae bacterium]
MRIVHLSTYDNKGGAALAAYRLHKRLQRAGHDSSMFVAERRSQDLSVVAFQPTQALFGRIQRRLSRRSIESDAAAYRNTRPSGVELFSDDRSKFGDDLVAQLPACDVVNLHWVADFVDYTTFFPAVAPKTPIVWRLADMVALTGGCHYDEECARFLAQCGACPQLGSTKDGDLSRAVWMRKRDAFARTPAHRLHIVALCRWMHDLVKRSPLLSRFPSSLIPNGVDLEAFSPRDRGFARQVLGIPQQAKVVMFVSEIVSSRRKGFGLLLEALAGEPVCPDVYLVSVGKEAPAVSASLPVLHMGYVDNDRWLSLIYSAADVFVIPSLQDNLPNTVLEAMACGTPVIGFGAGGITDMVRPEETGLLVPPGDVVGLRAAIRRVLTEDSRRAAMRERSRAVAESDYSRDLQVRRYVDLYQSLVAPTQS